MANTNKKGFTLYKKADGGVANGGRLRFLVSNGYATALAAGDPVYVSNGLIRVAANASAAAFADGLENRTYGVFDGCRYVDVNGQVRDSALFPAATSSTGRLEGETQVLGYVIPARGNTFIIPASLSVSALQVGALFSVTVSSPSTIVKRSQAKLDAAVASAGVAHMVRILSIPDAQSGVVGAGVEVEFALPRNIW